MSSSDQQISHISLIPYRKRKLGRIYALTHGRFRSHLSLFVRHGSQLTALRARFVAGLFSLSLDVSLSLIPALVSCSPPLRGDVSSSSSSVFDGGRGRAVFRVVGGLLEEAVADGEGLSILLKCVVC
jgi:hypothetical protein